MTTTNLLNFIGVAGGLGGLAALVKVLVDRTKVRTDAVDQIADTSVRLLTPLHEEIDRLRLSLRTAESELDSLRQQMRTLSEQQSEVEGLRSKVRTAEQTVETLRSQIRTLYDEIATKDRQLIEKDRLIAELRRSP